MHQQSGISQNSFACSQWQSTSSAELQRWSLKKIFAGKYLEQIKKSGITILATLAVGSIVFGAINLFLLQLANHGW